MGRKKKIVAAEPITSEPTTEPVTEPVVEPIPEVIPPIENPCFKEQFDKMYKITDKIVSKILVSGGSLEQDSYVVREEFGEALAAGYRYLRFQGDVSAKLRKAGHDDEERNYELEMYEEIADVFMMSTSLCRHHEWAFEDKDMVVVRPTMSDLELYLKKISEVLYRINTNSINETYIYEFLEETYVLLLNAPGTLDKKIDKLYNKIFKIVE